MPKYARDPVHGEIKLEDEFLPIADHPRFQRLRGIKQLGMAHLVYPGATHSRFLHCLGSYHISKAFEDPLISLYALIHDVGHPPLSHVVESALKNAGIDFDHDTISNKYLRDILSGTNFSLTDLKRAMRKGTLVHGDLGVDRMDYLIRDSYYTGVTSGYLHWQRMVRLMRAEKEKTIVHPKSVESVEQFFIARYIMGSTVYLHKTNLVIESMVSKAVEHLLHEVSHKEIVEMDDTSLVTAFRNSESAKTIWSRVEKRQIYKRIGVYNEEEKAKQVYTQLKDKVGSDNVVIGKRGKWYKPISVELETGENIVDVSPLIRTLVDADKKKQYYFVAINRDYLSQVKTFPQSGI
ncbi:MAG: HD domain-containing protein [Candidatus Altiarchaeota archaeon]|nr:HD domain-containing protein [Candidatus Altiarchaeota archaeon]